MRCVLLIVLLGTLCVAASADHVPTRATWDGWTIETTEEVWFSRRHSSYPVWQMFDRNPSTAWVYSGGFAGFDWGEEPSKLRSVTDKYQVILKPNDAVVLDEIRLMNGYQKDSATFGRNARILEVEVFALHRDSTKERSLGKFSLNDAMGWQSVRLPRGAYRLLRIVAQDLARGTDPDVAISEMEVLNQGRSIGPAVPDWIVSTDGDECGCGTTYQLRRGNGKEVASTGAEQGDIARSADGRFFAGVDRLNERTRLWVFDTRRNRFAVSRVFEQLDWWANLHWTADGRLLKHEQREGQAPPPLLWHARS